MPLFMVYMLLVWMEFIVDMILKLKKNFFLWKKKEK